MLIMAHVKQVQRVQIIIAVEGAFNVEVDVEA